MFGSRERIRSLKRAQPKLFGKVPPCLPHSLRALRQRDQVQYVRGIIQFLRKNVNVCHPSSDVGWWCCYQEQMKDLVTFLSEPQSSYPEVWSTFREEVSAQLSLCRQCAIAYHKAVNEWELGSEVSQWSKGVIRKRVSQLVEWDAHRLIPAIEKGAMSALLCEDPETLAARTQCREAFLESLLSLRLCMHERFCTAVGKVFRTRSPAKDDEDVTPFIKAHGSIPPGVAALCFHSSNQVRTWAKSIYLSSLSDLPADEQALHLLISKGLRLALSKATVTHEIYPSKPISWAPDFQCLWEGLDTLLTSIPSLELETMMKRNKKFPVIDAIFVSLSNAGNDFGTETSQGLPEMLNVLRYVLLRVRFVSLFEYGNLNPEKLLDAVFKLFKIRSRNSYERRLLLDIMFNVTSSSMRRGCTSDATSLFLKCFGFLEDLECSKSIGSHTALELGTLTAADLHNSRSDILNAGVRFLQRFYWHSWPRLPVDESKRIADFITKIVRGIPERERSWELLRNVLLTDVFNLIRCIYEPQEVELIANTFFSFPAETTSTVERKPSALESAIREIARSQTSLTWMDRLWNNVRRGHHISDGNKHNDRVRNFEASLALDLHRLVGTLDPKRCGELVKSDVFKAYRAQLNDKGGEHCVKRLVSRRMETVHETILSALQMMPDISGRYISLMGLPFHAAHLLSSFRGEVSKLAHRLLQRKCKIENATYALPQSRDKLLVHILQQDKDDSHMIFEGFISATRINSAQGATVSIRTYPSVLRWYSLLTSGGCRILRSGDVTRGIIRVLLTFLENWRAFESETSQETFREAVCRMFSIIPGIWDSFDDIEDNAEGKSAGKNEHFHKDVSPWFRKVASKLFPMHRLRDEVVRAAWVTMMTHKSLKPTVKSIDSYREILMEIISEHERRPRGLGYVECRQLADAFDLEEANQILDQWAVREARRAAGHLGKSKTSKTYHETRIDNFFSSKSCKTRPLDFMQDYIVSASEERSDVNRVQRRTIIAHKRQMGHCSMAPVRTNGSLHDLRRDHRQARAELRRAVPTCGSVSGNREPTKTRFELLREERIAERERKKIHIECDVNVTHPSEIRSEDMRFKDCLDYKRNESTNENLILQTTLREDIEPKEFSYPKSRRELKTRCMEQIKRDVLMSEDPHTFETEAYTKRPPDTFDDVESYVNYWEPLLIAEFRAGIRKKVDEERLFAEQNKSGQKNLGCRMVFEVDSPAENIGYLHTLSITSSSHHRGGESSQSGGAGNVSLDVPNFQVSDVVTLEISGAGQLEHDGGKDRSEVVLAIVATVVRTQKDLRLTLRVAFDNASAPGKGRLLKVGKVLSFAMLQRQLDALWSLPKMPDGILWSLLDPVEGWRMKRDLEARDEVAIDRNSSLPLQVIQKMESLGVLNASQGRAITDVVRSCSCLFASRGGNIRAQYTQHNHGSLSLIQGPPGTGKTSTIIAVLSALLSCLGSRPYRRKAKVIVDGTPHILNIPAIRILVCAPSNAAVDELMLRVMDDGLFTSSENRICPRLVRVGRGTTLEALRALEIHSLSKSEEEQPSSKDSAAPVHGKDHHKLLEEVNRHIGELDGERRKIALQPEKASDGTDTAPGLSTPGTERFREIGEQLNILHEKKKFLRNILSHQREAERREEVSRKREDLKTICNALATASVVFSTLSSSGHEEMKSLGVKFDVVIIDEAGQSCEPEALIPITLSQLVGSQQQRFMHTVLVGDPRQLPATVISNNHRVAAAMGQSLFERIGHSDASIVHLLNTQYRMHPKISSFPSKRFYGNRLLNSAAVSNKSMRKAWHRDEQKRFGPVTIYDTASTTTKEIRSRGGSLSNNVEAKLVIDGLMSLVRLYGIENLVDSIVILSPYKQQVVLLKRLVSSKAELKEAKVEVSTIDGIQGREKSVVLLSTVRSGHSKDIGFVKDDRRLNVALTRAKHTLMIFGHVEFLSAHSGAWAALISHCRESSQIISLTNASYNVFPESRNALRPRLPKELLRSDFLSDIDEDKDVSGSPACDPMEFRGTRSAYSMKVDVAGKETSRTMNVGRKGLIEKSSLKGVKCGSPRTHDDGHDNGKEKKRRQHGFQGVVINPSMVASKAEVCGRRSHPPDRAYDSNDPVLKRVRPLLLERQNDGARGRSIHLGSTSGEEQPGRPRDLSKTNANSTAQRLQVGALAKARAYPSLGRKAFVPQGRCASNHGEGGHSGQRPLSGSPPSGLQRPSHVVFKREPLDHTRKKKSTRNSNTSRPQARVPTASLKRSFYSSHGSDSALPIEPPRKRSRQESHWKQGAERRHVQTKGGLYSEQNKANSYVAQRRGFQTNATCQTRKQTGQRLVTHHQSRIRQSRDRQSRIPKVDVKRQSQPKSSRSAPAFSLADTQMKLKGTLDAARNARKSGSPR